MQRFRDFLKRKDIEISLRRYGIDALGAMAQGLFCSLLIGTILNTIGTQFHIGFLTAQIITINGVGYTIGGLASFMSGSAMAVAIGYALQAPPMVLFSLVTVGYACNALGGAGGPLAVLFVAIIAAEFGKNLRTYCPDVKHVVVIFNPADITGLVTLIYSGLKPSQVSTLAALDSTRLRSELARYFGISPTR